MRREHSNLNERYERLVATMDIPDIRKAGSPVNARWFLRNAYVSNTSHQNIEAVKQVAIELAAIQ